MKETIKKGFFFGLTAGITMLLVGLTYAAFQNITQVTKDDKLTADTFNKIITNQEDLKSRLDTLNEKQLATAWVNFDGTKCDTDSDLNGINECIINSQFNVSKVERFETGNYRVFFENKMSNINYTTVGTSDRPVNPTIVNSESPNLYFVVVGSRGLDSNRVNSPLMQIQIFGGN